MSVLKFINYHTEEVRFKRNPNFTKKGKVSLEPEIEANISMYQDEKATIDLSIKIDSDELPFNVFIKILGKFSFKKEESNEEIEFIDLLKMNGVAILYPYLRSEVTSVTSLSNEYPPYILPIINVSELLKEKKAIHTEK